MSEFSTTFIVAPYSAEDADVLFSLWSAGTVAFCDSAQTAGGCTECEGGTIEEIMKAVVKVKTIMKQEDNNIDLRYLEYRKVQGARRSRSKLEQKANHINFVVILLFLKKTIRR